MKFIPLDDRVIIEPKDSEEKTEGGIYIPDNAKEKPAQGTVVAFGRGRILQSGERLPVEVKHGDTVAYGKFAGTDLADGGKTYQIMRETDIIAILDRV